MLSLRASFPLHALAYAESTFLRPRGGMQLTNNLYTVRQGFTQPGETSDDAGRLIGRSELSIDTLPSNAPMILQDGGGFWWAPAHLM